MIAWRQVMTTAAAAAAANAENRSAEWVAANTRCCPRCHSRIQRDGGCNHMTCKVREIGVRFHVGHVIGARYAQNVITPRVHGAEVLHDGCLLDSVCLAHTKLNCRLLSVTPVGYTHKVPF